MVSNEKIDRMSLMRFYFCTFGHYFSELFFQNYFSDYIQPRLTISKTALRKIAYALAAVPTIICLCLVPACGCDSIWVTVLICISMGMKGFQV